MGSKKIAELGIDAKSVFVVRCRSCGFYYTDPMPFWTKNDLEMLYDEEYYSYSQMTDWWALIRRHVNPQRRLDAIQLYGPPKICCFLEVGCGGGFAMEEAMRRGWATYGQDISEHAAREVKGRLGLDVFLGPLEDAHFDNDFFDVIYVDSVLEHVLHPSAMMQEFHRILKPCGIVYAVMPNEDALIHDYRDLTYRVKGLKMSPKLTPLAPPYHIVGFTTRTLRLLAESNGFEVRSLKVAWDYETRRHRKYRWSIKGSRGNVRQVIMNQLWRGIYLVPK